MRFSVLRLVALGAATTAVAGAGLPPYLVVLAVGSGSGNLTTAAAPLALVTMAPNGTIVATQSVPCTQYGLPTGSPTSNQEGMISTSLVGACRPLDRRHMPSRAPAVTGGRVDAARGFGQPTTLARASLRR